MALLDENRNRKRLEISGLGKMEGEAPKALRLRFKFKKGCHNIQDLTSISTINELKAKLSQMSNIDPAALKVLNGFPPRVLDLSDGSAVLSSQNISSGDTLIVEEDESAKIKRNEEVLQDFQAQMNSANSGFLARHVVPSDNSCLFRSVHFVIHNAKEDPHCVEEMREVIAQAVQQDPVKFNTAYLEKSNTEYQEWIKNNASWGGAIDLAILSSHFRVEICVANIDSCNVTRYGEDQEYNQRVLLIYDGLHYDPLMLEPFESSEQRQTRFSTTTENYIVDQALEIAKEANSSRQYTDTNKFALRCGVCQQGLVGQKEAEKHAKQTGHTNFAEF